MLCWVWAACWAVRVSGTDIWPTCGGHGIWGGVILSPDRRGHGGNLPTGVVPNEGLPAGLGAKFETLSFSIFLLEARFRCRWQEEA